uniref:HAT C-terminal dimerisation domain-containing protein n=1 Tax=Latimeria chalumnae TaxID=7897 RepID=H3ASM6_LATCH
TNAQTLFTVVKDVVQFNLDIRNCRGQCYDGVANVSGVLSGLQARVKAEEPRAVYVHRMAHSLNLVVQDVMQHILFGRNFLTMIRELIICIPISPKKFACIEALQKTEDTAQRLHPFCPTRWCLHVTSLRSVDSNYATLLKFLDEIGNSDVTDTGAKAHRFLTQLQKFNTFFTLQLLVSIFQLGEAVNTGLQKSTLHFQDAQKMLLSLKENIQLLEENGFDNMWKETCAMPENLEIEEPHLPQVKKPPQHLDEGSSPHRFATPMEVFTKCTKVLDQVNIALNTGFESAASEHLSRMEQFVIGSSEMVTAEQVVEFYESDFDAHRLQLHQDMFLDLARQQDFQISSVDDANLKKKYIRDLLPEFCTFLRALLTALVSTWVAERSFSSVAVLHVHQHLTRELDVNIIADEFIQRAAAR